MIIFPLPCLFVLMLRLQRQKEIKDTKTKNQKRRGKKRAARVKTPVSPFFVLMFVPPPKQLAVRVLSAVHGDSVAAVGVGTLALSCFGVKLPVLIRRRERRRWWVGRNFQVTCTEGSFCFPAQRLAYTGNTETTTGAPGKKKKGTRNARETRHSNSARTPRYCVARVDRGIWKVSERILRCRLSFPGSVSSGSRSDDEDHPHPRQDEEEETEAPPQVLYEVNMAVPLTAFTRSGLDSILRRWEVPEVC